MQIVIIGSGPSLHPDDLDAIRGAGVFTIAINSAWKSAPWCDAIFAGDGTWWQHYGHEVTIEAERWSCINQSQLYGTRWFKGSSGWNSGANGILFALEHKQPSTIILTGFDCSLKHGTHHHGDHTKTPNPKPADVARWHAQFDQAARRAKKAGVTLLNASRYTEIRTIQRATLREALHGGDGFQTRGT